ncbi:MAG: hypothetical protein WA373_04135 [Burkholderiales bacterium]
MIGSFTKSIFVDSALGWLGALGYSVLHGPNIAAIAAGELAAERSDPNYPDVVLDRRLHQAFVRLNPDLLHEVLENARRKLMRSDAPSLGERIRANLLYSWTLAALRDILLPKFISGELRVRNTERIAASDTESTNGR